MLEYAVIENQFLGPALAELDRMAREGWRLVQVVPVPDVGPGLWWMLIVQRLVFEELEEVQDA